MNSSTKTESRSDKRRRFINYIYYFELMSEPFSTVKAFEDGDFSPKELEMLEAIGANYEKYKTLISKFIVNNWKWDRLDPLERAILIFGAFELKINDKSRVIFEIVDFTKAFIPDDNAYKFINKILDQIGGFYERIKASKVIVEAK